MRERFGGFLGIYHTKHGDVFIVEEHDDKFYWWTVNLLRNGRYIYNARRGPITNFANIQPVCQREIDFDTTFQIEFVQQYTWNNGDIE